MVPDLRVGLVFINRQRLAAASPQIHGDDVQCGPEDLKGAGDAGSQQMADGKSRTFSKKGKAAGMIPTAIRADPLWPTFNNTGRPG